MRTAEWAHRYAAFGWRVFPVVPGGKRPLYRGWQRDATTDPDQINRYWREEPAPNIGVVTGESFDVFDIEARYLRGFLILVEERSDRPLVTPTARSGGGGLHLYIKPTGLPGSRDLYLAGVHIGELKGPGGYVVASPSVTDGAYEWLAAPGVTLMSAAEDWLLDLLERPRRLTRPVRLSIRSAEDGLRRLNRLEAAVRRAPEGRRNKVLYWAARRAAEEGILARYACACLLDAGLSAGLLEGEVERTIRSAYEADGAAR